MQSIRDLLTIGSFYRLTSTVRNLGLVTCLLWSASSLPAQTAQVVTFAGEPGSI